MFPKKKITIAITGLVAFVILVKGIPFGNPVPIPDVWVWLWRGVFLLAVFGMFAKSIKTFVNWVMK